MQQANEDEDEEEEAETEAEAEGEGEGEGEEAGGGEGGGEAEEEGAQRFFDAATVATFVSVFFILAKALATSTNRHLEGTLRRNWCSSQGSWCGNRNNIHGRNNVE